MDSGSPVQVPGGLFSLADPEDLRGKLHTAGFETVRIKVIPFHLTFSDFDDYWRFILEFAGAVAVLLNSLTDEQRGAVRDATEQGAVAFRTSQGYDFPGVSVNAVTADGGRPLAVARTRESRVPKVEVAG